MDDDLTEVGMGRWHKSVNARKIRIGGNSWNRSTISSISGLALAGRVCAAWRPRVKLPTYFTAIRKPTDPATI